jgi:AraC-like DNA-binding protein
MKATFKSIKMKWLSYYLLILIIPLVGAGISFFYTNKIVTEELVKSKTALLNHTQENIEHSIAQLDLIWKDMIWDTTLKELLAQNTDEKIFTSKALPVQHTLLNYQSTIVGVDVLVYVQDYDYVLSPTTSNYVPYFYNAMASTGKLDLSTEQWRQLLAQKVNSSDCRFSTYYSYTHPGIASLTKGYIIPKSIMNNSLNANVFVSIPLSYIYNQINTSDEDTFILLDKDGYVLHAFQDSTRSIDLPRSFDITSTDAGNSIVSIGKTPYILSYTDFLSSGLRLAALTPQKEFWNTSNYIKYVTLTSLLSAILIGLVSVALFLRSNYRPIERILDLLHINKGSNEYDAIFYSFEKLHNENNTYKKKLVSQQEQIQNSYLISQLYGRFSYLSDDDMRQYLNIDLEHCHFSIVALHKKEKQWMDFYEQANKKINYGDLPFSEDLAFFMIHNVFSELLKDKFSYYRLIDGNLLVYLFTLPSEAKDSYPQELSSIVHSLFDFFENNMRLPIGILTSDVCTDFSTIHTDYQKILSCYEYQYVSESYSILKTSDLSDSLEYDSELSKFNILCSQLDTALCLKYHKEALKLTDQLFNLLNNELNKPFAITRLLMIQATCKVFVKLGLESEQHACTDDLLMTVCVAEDHVTLKKSFLAIMDWICRTDSPELEKGNTAVIRSIEQYVKKNYTDINLSLNTIADKVKLSPKYVSMIFKTATSTGLLDYINFIRIQKAKELLSTTKMTIDDIALQVGYSNSKTFRRAFLKFEGTTPGKFKALP